MSTEEEIGFINFLAPGSDLFSIETNYIHDPGKSDIEKA